jgi:periplasmic protein TonB
MFPKFNIYDTEWLDLIFKGRNQSYGAYELRKHYARTLLRSMGVTALILLGIFLAALSQSKNIEVSVTPSTQPTVVVDISKELTIERTHPQVATTHHKHNGGEPVVIPAQSAGGPAVVPAATALNHGAETAVNTAKPVIAPGIAGASPVTTQAQPLDESDVMPEPNGGKAALNNFLKQNLQYPEAAAKNGISGRLWLSFVVEIDGTLSDIHVTQPAGFGFDEEAIRVLKLAPAWQPGMQNGRAVRVRYNLPVTFRIVK